MNIREQIAEIYNDEELLYLPEEYDRALLGVVNMFDRSVVAYGLEKVIEVLQDYHGMDRDGAEEFFSYNILGSYVGKKTPVFVEFFVNLVGNENARKGKRQRGDFIVPIFHDEEAKYEITRGDIPENDTGGV